MITGINHLTLAVRDVAASWAFYTEVLGMRPVARWPRGAYLLAGEVWVALVWDANARTEALPEYSHVAWSVAPVQFAPLSERIRAAGALIWQENWTEGESLYFLDPDGHKLEIHASDLTARLQAARAQPWEGLELFEAEGARPEVSGVAGEAPAPRPPPLSAAVYDAIADWYDASVRAGVLIHELMLPQMLTWAGDLQGREVCDLACGQGWLARELARRGALVTGIDLSAGLLAKARAYEAEEVLGIAYVQDDAQLLASVPDGRFDGVTCNMALTDIPDSEAAFGAVARVLRSDGWFIFSITHPCFQTADSRWVTSDDGATRREVGSYFSEGFWRSDNPDGVRGKVGAHHRTLSSYLNSLRAAGFTLEELAEPQAEGPLAQRLPGYTVVPAVLLVYCRKGGER